MLEEKTGQPVKVLHGLDIDLQLYNDKIILRRTHWLSRLMRGDRTIFINELNSVNLVGHDKQHRPYFRLNENDGKPVIFCFKSGELQTAQELNSKLDNAIGQCHIVGFPTM